MCGFWLLGGAARADVTVSGQTVVRLTPTGIGGTNIIGHDTNNFVSGAFGINFQADAAAAGVPLIRTNAFPDDRTSQSASFFDAKVGAIVHAGAVPVLIAYLPAALTDTHPYAKNGTSGTYLKADGTSGGTLASNVVALVKRYMAAPYNLQTQYWEVSNEPDITVDFQTPSAAYYASAFRAVHDALVSAGLRDHVKLMGPVTTNDYRWSSVNGYNTQITDYFLTHCNDILDVLDTHSYSGSGDDAGLLNTPHKMDNFYDTGRTVSITGGSPYPDGATQDYGASSVLLRMAQIPFGRPRVGVAITEHNAYTTAADPYTGLAGHHVISVGLWNMALTHFLLYNPRGEADTSFVFDTYGNNEGGFGHYDDAKNRDYAYYALWMRNNLTGPVLLGQSTTNNRNSSGNPFLLVTVSRSSSTLYMEVINRRTDAPITDTVHLTNVPLSGAAASVYTMANGVFPTTPASFAVGADFAYTFPACSVTTFAVPLSAVPTLALTALPTVQTVNPGNSTTFSVTGTPLGGFSSPVSYSLTGLPSGAAYTVGAGTDGASATLTVGTQTTTPTGSYPLTVRASGGGGTWTFPVTLNVLNPDFQFYASPATRSVAQGASYTFSDTLLAAGGFTGVVTFRVTGLPAGVTVAAPQVDTQGTGTGITLMVANYAAPGTYPLQFTATGGGVSHSVPITLTITSAGNAVSGKVTLQGYAANNQAQGLTLTFRPASGTAFTRAVTPAADGTFSALGIPPASYTLLVKGAKWLQKAVPVDATAGDAGGVTATLLTGDVDNNNAVSAPDYARLKAAYGATPTSTNWQVGADLNGDNRVSAIDYALLKANYGKQGDK